MASHGVMVRTRDLPVITAAPGLLLPRFHLFEQQGGCHEVLLPAREPCSGNWGNGWRRVRFAANVLAQQR
jgi:hypothetical protein